MRLEFADVGHLPYMIPRARPVNVSVLQLFPDCFLTDGDGLLHGAIAVPRATRVVNLARSRVLVKTVEGIHQVVTVDIVSHLLALVTKHRVRVRALSIPLRGYRAEISDSDCGVIRI